MNVGQKLSRIENPTFQPVYNYCKFYQPKLEADGECTFDKSIVVDCPLDAEYTFAPFEMESSVATENNMVRWFDLMIPYFLFFFSTAVSTSGPRRLTPSS